MIQDKLGGGNFGQVYLGIWQGTTQVALKSVDNTLDLFQEMMMLKSLNHPNIIRYLGVYKDPSETASIVTEFLSFGSLSSYLRRETSNLKTEDLLAMYLHLFICFDSSIHY